MNNIFAMLLMSPKRFLIQLTVVSVFVVANIGLAYHLYSVFMVPHEAMVFDDAGHPVGRMDMEKISALAPNGIILRRVSWPGGPAGVTSIVPVLAAKDRVLPSRICDYSVNIAEIIKQELRRRAPRGEHLSARVLAATSAAVTDRVNKRLGKVWFKTLYLLDDITTPVLFASTTCQPTSGAFAKV